MCKSQMSVIFIMSGFGGGMKNSGSWILGTVDPAVTNVN